MTTKLWVARSGNWVKSGQSPVPFASVSQRDQLVYGTYKPDLTTTGVLPGVARTVVNSASAMPGGGIFGGSTYENLTLNFIMTPPTGTTRITFKNCLLQGPNSAPTGAVGMAKLYNANHCPVDFIDCSFIPQLPHPNYNGLHGYGFRAYRCQLLRCVDSVSVFNTNAPTAALGVELWGCYSDNHAWFSQAQAAALGLSVTPDGTHSDGVQLQGGDGFLMRGCNFRGFNDPDYFNTFYNTNHNNATMMIKPDVGLITNTDIQQNWYDGGAATINVAHDDPSRHLVNLGVFKNSRFGHNARLGDTWVFNRPSDVTIDVGTSGPPDDRNKFEDTLAVITYRNA